MLLLTLLVSSTKAQIGGPTPSPTQKLSEILSKNLETYDAKAEVTRERREQAYASLMAGQRFIWRTNQSRSQAAGPTNARLARTAILKALELDPGLAEGYTALAELSVSAPPSDVDEAVELASMAVKLKKDNFGAHRILARLYTYKSHLNSGPLDRIFAEKAIAEWREVARLDPRNAEAWAFLSEFYEATNQQTERIEALRKWFAASTPLENQFYRRVMGGREDLAPESASLKLGSALLKAGRIQEAVEVVSKVVADEPENAEAVELLKQAVESADKKTSALAVDALHQAVYADPKNLSLISLLAQIQARIGHLDDAARTLNEASSRFMATDRTSAAAVLVSLGDIYAEADRLAEAATAYEKSIAARGLSAARSIGDDEREFVLTVFEKLITVYKRANRIADAKAAIVRARRLLGRDDLFADKQLVSLLRESGRRAEALALLQTVRARFSGDLGLLRLHALVLTESGHVDRAVTMMKRRPTITGSRRETKSRTANGSIANISPLTYDDFSNYLFISQLYSDAKRGKEAIAAAEKAFSLADGDERRQIARLMVATAQQTSGDFAAAETTLRDILKQTPGNPIALNNLGYFLLERDERFAEALKMIEQALKVEPTNPSYLDSLGWAHFKLQNYDQAERALRNAARLDPASATIQEHLGDLYWRRGKPEEAVAAWRRALQLGSAGAETTRLKEKIAAVK